MSSIQRLEAASDSEEEVVLARPLIQAADASEGAMSAPDFGNATVAIGTPPPTPDLVAEASSPPTFLGTQWLGSTWWDRHFQLVWEDCVAVLKVRLRGLGVRDSDVESLSIALDSFLARQASVAPAENYSGSPLVLELDVSENNLSDIGGIRLLAWLSDLVARHTIGVYLRILKLFRNRLGDETCLHLSRFILAQNFPIHEVHLSHNRIGQRGFTLLLVALATHPMGAYPRPTSYDTIPCWMRIEHNEVSEVDQFLDALQKPPVGLRFCPAHRKAKGQGCTSHYCCMSDGVVDLPPHVHLFCVREQGPGVGCGVRKNVGELLQNYAAELVLDGGDLKASVAASVGAAASALALAAQPTTITVPDLDFAKCRDVKLRVDQERGAGLELEADTYGYLVVLVEVVPGQDLEPSDVVLEINDVKLWGGLREDELGHAFGSRFADGARLRVARRSDVACRALLQPLGLGVRRHHSEIPIHGDRRRVNDVSHATRAPISERCEALRGDLLKDLVILGHRCCLTTAPEVHEELGGSVLLRGPPRAQRSAVEELRRLMPFYFPELQVCGLEPPQCHWWGEVDMLCGDGTSAPCEPRDVAGNNVDMSEWEGILRKECSEDDALDDEDLPFEPLEGPDEGPDVFEGNVVASSLEMDRPLRVVMLVGLPGSGKSTVAERFRRQGWVVVNQDELGNRHACAAKAREALARCDCVVVDRCNMTRLQRRVWLGIADEFDVAAAALWLDVPVEECGRRVMLRFGHATLPADSSSLGVIEAFHERRENPVEAEGFVLWRGRDDGEIDDAFEELLELVEWSASNAKDMGWNPKGHANGRSDVARDKRRQNRQGEKQREDLRYGSSRSTSEQRNRSPCFDRDSSFRYVDARDRVVRSLFLRAVRRQVEYYFSDANLRNDWFFQGKIACKPHEGWLELRWILSCPRIKNVHGATADDVLQALGPSSLIVKEMDGTHWIKRGRFPPELSEQRPESGKEPDWYKELHVADPECLFVASLVEPTVTSAQLVAEAQQAEQALGGGTEPLSDLPTCASCHRQRARELFSKAQLTKHRRSPICKDCVGGASAG